MKTPTLLYACRPASPAKGPDVHEQIARCRRFCEDNGHEIRLEISDPTLPGTKTGDRLLQQLRSALHAREVDLVVVVDTKGLLRRLGRDLPLLDALDFAAITLHSLSEGQTDLAGFALQAMDFRWHRQALGEAVRRGEKAARAHRAEAARYPSTALHTGTILPLGGARGVQERL